MKTWMYVVVSLCLVVAVSAAVVTDTLSGTEYDAVLGGDPLVYVNSPMLLRTMYGDFNPSPYESYLYLSNDWIEQRNEYQSDESNPNVRSVRIYGLNSGSIGGAIRAYGNTEDYTYPNNINVLAYGSCMMDFNTLVCVNKDTPYFSVTEESLTLPVRGCSGKLVTDAAGVVSCGVDQIGPAEKGWSGTCPGDYKLVVKNGLVTDCKRK
jgi:hypothetical protein